MKTHTGHFPIGFRVGGSEWQRDLPTLIDWAKSSGFSRLDLKKDADSTASIVVDAGLKIGSVDLVAWKEMISVDPETRRKAVETQTAYIEKVCAITGPMRFFVVMLPEDPSLPAKQNFDLMVESYRQTVAVLERHGSQIVIEGWPGPGALACTPETVRALFQQIPSPAMGLNYDPSHLVRLGIDPMRFLEEFVGRVYHVHGKDTWVYENARYEYGIERRSVFEAGHDYGANLWRYTIPGRGLCDWTAILARLQQAGYNGAVCIELEDERYNGTIEGEQRGLIESRDFLAGC